MLLQNWLQGKSNLMPHKTKQHKEASARIEAELAQRKLEFKQMEAKKQIKIVGNQEAEEFEDDMDSVENDHLQTSLVQINLETEATSFITPQEPKCSTTSVTSKCRYCHLNRYSDGWFIQHESPASTCTNHLQRRAHPLSGLEVVLLCPHTPKELTIKWQNILFEKNMWVNLPKKL